MAFKKFAQRRQQLDPCVYFWKRGIIGFNNGAISKFELDKFKFVILYFDEDTRRVGFGFTNDENDPAAIKLSARKTGYTLAAKSFFNLYGISIGDKVRHVLKFDADEGLLVIQLPSPEPEPEQPAPDPGPELPFQTQE